MSLEEKNIHTTSIDINSSAILEYFYSDDSTIVSDVDQCVHRVVTIKSRKKTLSETLDVYNHLRKYVDRKTETIITGLAVRGETWADTRTNAKLFGPRARLGAVRVELTDKILERAEYKASSGKCCTCFHKIIVEKYKRLWVAKLSLFEEDHSPYKQIVLASLPIVGSLFLVSFYTTVDTIIVSRHHGTREIASILNFLPFEQILTLSPMQALGTATASQISVSMGAKNFPDVEMTFSIFFVIGCCIAVFVPLIFVPTLPLFLPHLGVIKEYVGDVLRYGYISLTFMPLCNLLGPAMVPILRCENKAVLVMLRQILGVVLNIILDLIFIAALHFGNSGAAIATVISMSITGAWISSHFFVCKRHKANAEKEHKTRFISFNSTHIRCAKKQFYLACRLIGLSVSSYIQFFLLNFGALLSLILHKYWMPDDIAHVRQVGVSIAARTTLIFSNPIAGIQNGILPVLGYNVGQGSPRRIYEVSKAGLVILLIATTTQLVLFQLLAPYVIRIYNLEEAYFNAGVRALRLINAMVPMISFSTLALVLFQVRKKQYHAIALQMAKVAAQVFWQLVIPYAQKDSKELVAGVPFSDAVAGAIGLCIVIVEFRHMRRKVKEEIDAEFSYEHTLRTFDLSRDGQQFDADRILLIYRGKGSSQAHNSQAVRFSGTAQSLEMSRVSSTTAFLTDNDIAVKPDTSDQLTINTFNGLYYTSPLAIPQNYNKNMSVEISSDVTEENLPCYTLNFPGAEKK